MTRFVEVRPASPPVPEGVSKSVSKGTSEKKDGDAGERIVKYMPVEIVSGYVFVSGLVPAVTAGTLQTVAAWLCFAVGLIVTPIYLFSKNPKPEQVPQVWIATVAFVLWAYLLGGPFALAPLAPYYSAPFGAVLVGLYTWAVGLFYDPKAT